MLLEKLFYEYKPYWTLLIADRASTELNSPIANWSALILFCVSVILVWERYRYRIQERTKVLSHQKIQAEIKRYKRKKRSSYYG